jgi:hypothetical protein
MPWTIDSPSISGDSFANVGVSSCVAVFNGGSGDRCTLFIPGNCDGTKPFQEFDAVEIINPSSVVFFRGFVTSCLRAASGNSEGFEVIIEGRLKVLDRIVFLQRVAIYDTVAEDAGFAYLSDCNLGYDDAGERLNSAETITDILSFAAAAGSGITAGSILTGLDVTLPQMEATEMSCLEAIRRVLAFHPDCVLYFDHASGTVNVARPGTMSVVTKASEGDGSGVTRMELDQRRRFPVAGVTIQWKTTTTVDDVTSVTVVTDTAGTAAPAKDVAVFTIPLQGDEIITQSQEAITEDLPEAAGDLTNTEWRAFLAKHFQEWAACGTITNGAFVVVSVTQEVDSANKVGLGTAPASYPRMLTGGAVPPWQSGISAAPTRFTVRIRPGAEVQTNPAFYELFAKGNEIVLPLTMDVMGTDAQSITYRTVTSYTEGEEPIEGLAADYYAAMNVDAPAGTWTKVAEEADITPMPGKRLTLTGDFPVTTAVIQQTTVDIFAGRTSVVFGPVSIRTPADSFAMMRAGNRRSRMRNVGGGNRTSASPAGREIKGSGGGRAHNTHRPTPVRSKKWFTLEQLDEVTAGTVTIRCCAGRFAAAEIVDGASDPILPTYSEISEHPVGETDIAGVEHNDCIFLRVVYNIEESFTGTEGDGLSGVLLHTASMTASGATVVKGTSGEFDFFSGIESGDYVSYFRIGKISIDSSIVTIEQHWDGLFTAPCLEASWFDPSDYTVEGLPYLTPDAAAEFITEGELCDAVDVCLGP